MYKKKKNEEVGVKSSYGSELNAGPGLYSSTWEAEAGRSHTVPGQPMHKIRVCVKKKKGGVLLFGFGVKPQGFFCLSTEKISLKKGKVDIMDK